MFARNIVIPQVFDRSLLHETPGALAFSLQPLFLVRRTSRWVDVTHPGEQHVPFEVMLIAIDTRTREVSLEGGWRPYVIDVVPLPAARSAASAGAAYLIREDLCDATAYAVIMRLDDSPLSVFVDELDETLVIDCRHELRIHHVHIWAALTVPSSTSTRLGRRLGFV
jgi:hypothetical protein